MAGTTRLELATSGVTGRFSRLTTIYLALLYVFKKLIFSDPDPLGTKVILRASESSIKSKWKIGISFPVLVNVLCLVTVCRVFDLKGYSMVALLHPAVIDSFNLKISIPAFEPTSIKYIGSPVSWHIRFLSFSAIFIFSSMVSRTFFPISLVSLVHTLKKLGFESQYVDCDLNNEAVVKIYYGFINYCFVLVISSAIFKICSTFPFWSTIGV